MIDNTSAISEFFLVPGKILYCNGMGTLKEDAEAHAKAIADLTGVEVELHYNNTTTLHKALLITSKVSLGILGAGYAVGSLASKVHNKWITRAVGCTSIATLISGAVGWSEIEKQKDASAQILADKVKAYLEAHPLHHITMIFHSQGADIGHRALKKLDGYKQRINVVAIGGIVNIPDSFANRVVNFVNDNDMIAYIAHALFDQRAGTKTKVQIEDKMSDYLGSHYSTGYLNKSQVKEAIQEFAKPRHYSLIRSSGPMRLSH